jgi:DNA (cytosine-5)-methyltransferase 1
MNQAVELPDAEIAKAPAFTDFIHEKIERYRSGEKLRILDLFSGCGGLSLGFQKEGFEIVAGIEMDREASRSHAMNFHKGHAHFEEYARSRDILQTSPSDLFNDIGLKGDNGRQIDIIIGGPPCQAFTRVGRAKLREVLQHESAFLNDPRSQLYKRYLAYVKETAPIAILMENVPDMLNYGGGNIAELVCDDLVEYGYRCQYTLLNSVYYGIPQMRERMFLVAVHESIAATFEFPTPTHHAELPRGYHGSRNVALKHINQGVGCVHYVKPPSFPDHKLARAVSAKDALSDLPVITEHLQNLMKRGTKKTGEKIPYGLAKHQNSYQQVMRDWPGFKKSTEVSGNVIRNLPRDYPIFKRMKPGDQYPQAFKIANELLAAKVKKEEKLTGKPLSEKSKKYEELLAETVPPYDASKFPNKWRKMEADLPARTLMAHLGKDSYSHIHYDSDQARPISVREAARLQSFPDGFEFAGAMNAAFRQIGNAVPPLMAAKIAAAIKLTLENGINVRRPKPERP